MEKSHETIRLELICVAHWLKRVPVFFQSFSHNTVSSEVKSCVNLLTMIALIPVFLNWSLYSLIDLTYREDITCPRVDMNFIFEWSTRYLTSERSERVRYRVDHEKIKFISISGHVMFCLLYKHQWNTKPFYFNIFNGLKGERVVTKHGRSTWTKTKFIW